MRQQQKNRVQGFTLIELLVVLVIIAVLAAILFPVFARARENARRASCMSNMKQMALAIMQYTQDYDEHYPMKWYQNPDGSGVSQTLAGWPGKTYEVYSINGNPKVLWYWTTWQDMIYPYVKNVQIFRCPSYTSTGPNFSYEMNGAFTGTLNTYDYNAYPANTLSGTPMSAILRPAETVMTFEVRGIDATYGLNGAISDMPPYQDSLHLEGTNLAYGDGHVKWMSTNQLIALSGTVGGVCYLPHHYPQ